MKVKPGYGARQNVVAFSIAISLIGLIATTRAQSQELQEKLAQIKQSTAANKAALARYTWQEQQTISLKGEVKKVQLFQVRIGPDGTQQKTELNPAPPPEPPSGGRFKQRVVAKKKEEFKEYAEQIAALAKQYTKPDPDALQQAFQAGNVSFVPGPGGVIKMVIKNYIKPNDSMTLTFSSEQKAIQSIQVSSYLDDPKDAVTIAAQFAKLPDGTNHVSASQVNGVSKQLLVATQNSNYGPA